MTFLLDLFVYVVLYLYDVFYSLRLAWRAISGRML